MQDALPSNWHTHPPTKRLCGVKRARVAVREARQLDEAADQAVAVAVNSRGRQANDDVALAVSRRGVSGPKRNVAAEWDSNVTNAVSTA